MNPRGAIANGAIEGAAAAPSKGRKVQVDPSLDERETVEWRPFPDVPDTRTSPSWVAVTYSRLLPILTNDQSAPALVDLHNALYVPTNMDPVFGFWATEEPIGKIFAHVTPSSLDL